MIRAALLKRKIMFNQSFAVVLFCIAMLTLLLLFYVTMIYPKREKRKAEKYLTKADLKELMDKGYF